MVNVIQFSTNVKEIAKFFDDNKISTHEQIYFNTIIGIAKRKANNKHLTAIQFKNYLNCETKLLDDKFDDIIGFDGFSLWYNNNFIKIIVLSDDLLNTYKRIEFNTQLISNTFI